jgi:PAS domain S-box-containing protein
MLGNDLKAADNVNAPSVPEEGKILHLLPSAVYVCDASGYITLFNKAAADLWGREPELGKELWCGSYRMYDSNDHLLLPEQSPMALTIRQKRAVTGMEIIIERPDGEKRAVATHPQPIFDDAQNLTGAVNMLVDITHIRQSELALKTSEGKLRTLAASLEKEVEKRTADLKSKNEELQKSEERYHKMVEEVEDYAIILLDSNGIIQNWNRGAEKIKGYREDEIVGRSFEAFYREEDRKRGMPHMLINQARVNGKAIHEGWRVRKDGTTFWGSIVLTALHDDKDNVIGFSKVTRDLTERKLAEDKMKQYTSELEFQNKELEQFAYAASHDMKEPLRKIHFYNSYILEHNGPQLEGRSREYMERSLNAAQRMANLIDDLLTYSRATSSTENFADVDLNAMVGDIAATHRDELAQIDASIEIEPLPVIRAVPFQFRQLLENLLSNSIKYRQPDRHLRIVINSGRVKGSATGEREADPELEYFRLTIADNGTGFEQQYAEKIFEVFQRLNNVQGAKGSGIGLAICKKIVQNHKGFIRAEGKTGEGTRFDIFIPAG